MAVTVDDALCLDEKGAAVEMRKQMVIRYLLICVVAALSFKFKIVEPVFLVISLLTIKAGAYMQPVIHRFVKWRKDN